MQPSDVAISDWSGTEIRVSLSHASKDVAAAAVTLAANLEQATGAFGSTIIPTTGRWRGDDEPGAIVALVIYRRNYVQQYPIIERVLRESRVALDMTLFVTTTPVEVREVF